MQVQSTVPAVTVEDLTEPQAKDSDKESSDEDYVPAATTSKFRSRVRRVKQGQATGSEAKDVSELSSGEDKSMSTQVTALSHMHVRVHVCTFEYIHVHVDRSLPRL